MLQMEVALVDRRLLQWGCEVCEPHRTRGEERCVINRKTFSWVPPLAAPVYWPAVVVWVSKLSQ
jgi:hypothetical protein